MMPEWPGGELAEPDEILLDFLAKLPATIKEAVVAGCIIAFDLIRLDPQQDKLADLKEALKEGNALRRSYQCAMLIGAVELTLEHYESDEEYYQKLWTEYGAEIFRDMALRAPLRDRHYHTARQAFYELRGDKLSARMLHIWQHFLTAKDHIEQSSS